MACHIPGPIGAAGPGQNQSLEEALKELGYRCYKIKSICECNKKGRLVAGADLADGTDAFKIKYKQYTPIEGPNFSIVQGYYHVVRSLGNGQYLSKTIWTPNNSLSPKPVSGNQASADQNVYHLYCCHK